MGIKGNNGPFRGWERRAEGCGLTWSRTYLFSTTILGFVDKYMIIP